MEADEISNSLHNLQIAEHISAFGVRILGIPVSRDDLWVYIDKEHEEAVRWHEFPVSDKDESVSALAIAQTADDVTFPLMLHQDNKNTPLLDFMFHHESDDLVVRNNSHAPFCFDSMGHDEKQRFWVNPLGTQKLGPSSFTLSMSGTVVLQLRVLPRCSLKIHPAEIQSIQLKQLSKNRKRRRASEEPEVSNEHPPVKQAKMGHLKDDKILILRPHPSEKGRMLPKAPVEGNALTLAKDQKLILPGTYGLDGYTLLYQRHLGEGGQGLVYLALHSLLGEIVVKASKSRKQERLDPEMYVRAFVQDAETWFRESFIHSQLSHKHIVDFVGFDARIRTIYLRRIDADDLSCKKAGSWRDKDGRFTGSIDDTLEILQGAASALEYIHKKGFEHNDIKPANILFSRELGAYLCDFGLAEYTGRGPTTSGGSPWYIPPEYVVDDVRGPAGDIWALGITLMYLRRHIALPDAYAFGWKIADIHRQPQPTEAKGRHQKGTAKEDMLRWIRIITQKVNALDKTVPINSLLADMLTEDPSERLTAVGILERLSYINQVPSTTSAGVSQSQASTPAFATSTTQGSEIMTPATSIHTAVLGQRFYATHRAAHQLPSNKLSIESETQNPATTSITGHSSGSENLSELSALANEYLGGYGLTAPLDAGGFMNPELTSDDCGASASAASQPTAGAAPK